MKKILIVLLAAVCSLAQAQQLPHFSQYMLNGYLINPAVAGSENYGEAKVGYRNQWTGLEGAPKSYYLTLQMPISKIDRNTTAATLPSRDRNSRKFLYRKYMHDEIRMAEPHHGVGLTAIADKAGALSRSDIGLTYAYHLPLNTTMNMSVGLSGGVSVYNIDQRLLLLSNPSDPAFTDGGYNRVKPNITAGALLYSKRFYIGVTTAQVLQDELTPGQTDLEKQNRSYMHSYLTGGYKVVLSKDLSLLPSVLLKYVRSSSVSADANLKVLFSDKIWAGCSYRHNDAVILLGGVNVNNMFQLGYAYDMASGRISKSGYGSHEVVLGILLNNKARIYSPSDFW
ncbi:PorP/SprF family type IX secretion system membrane protein [Pontibacter vulgaris]|uniref:PorP/SprF family type IX secretion system membrane protein n=1 Tax=Pontibacter vulgaris TaxID=2905679 RepID=UPI001FA7B9A4|nr:type IX secretion system membrane protein PorP/SprF [Pontibacter vulgaris]